MDFSQPMEEMKSVEDGESFGSRNYSSRIRSLFFFFFLGFVFKAITCTLGVGYVLDQHDLMALMDLMYV